MGNGNHNEGSKCAALALKTWDLESSMSNMNLGFG